MLRKTIISYDYSASLWRSKNQKNKNKYSKKFAGFAPSFNDLVASESRSCHSEEFYTLKCSEEEVEGIKKIIGGEIFSGVQASKEAFQKHADDYQILHLATHACVDEENAMLNKIHFTDNYLSSYDLSILDLNADLVVLSACNTGTGKLLKGEGMMSLARSFRQAGCQSTVMSLWPVNDCSTAAIMKLFYSNLSKGEDKNLALRNAKLSYLESANKMERSPFYWAAFIQSGNVDVLNYSKGFFSKKYFWLLPIIMLMLFFFFKRKS